MPVVPILLGLAAVALLVAAGRKSGPREPSSDMFVPLSANVDPGSFFLHGRAPLASVPSLSKDQVVLVPFGVLTSMPPFAEHLVLARLRILGPADAAGAKKWNARIDEIVERVPGAMGGPKIGSTATIEPYNILMIVT